MRWRQQHAEPQPSTPQLFDTIDKSRVPCASSASMSAMGLPERPNPPTASDAPSGMSATASAAEANTCRSRVTPSSTGHVVVPASIVRAAAALAHPHACDVDAGPRTVHIMDTSPARTVPGAQSVARAAALLRLVTAAGDEGLSVADLARRADLTRPTTHRLLTALRHEGLVDQDESTGRWMPGPELYLMGTVAASRYDITAIARDIVRSLAVRTEESAFLSVRRGDETVCLIREDGAFPIRSFVLSEGVRFPLGVASAGLAILAFLPPHDVAPTSSGIPSSPSATAPRTPSRGCARDCARRTRAATRDPGHIGPAATAPARRCSPDPGTRRGAEPDRRGFPLLPQRIPELGRTLLAHAHQLTTRVAAGTR